MHEKKFLHDVLSLGLSQIYLNQTKLDNIIKWFDKTKIELYETLPVFEFENGKYTLTDGDSRAYIAYLSGCKQIVTHDNDEIVTNIIGRK